MVSVAFERAAPAGPKGEGNSLSQSAGYGHKETGEPASTGSMVHKLPRAGKWLRATRREAGSINEREETHNHAISPTHPNDAPFFHHTLSKLPSGLPFPCWAACSLGTLWALDWSRIQIPTH